MPLDIAVVQKLRKLALLVAIVAGGIVFALTDSVYPNGQTVHEMIEWIGVVLIVICILGRTWASLYSSGSEIPELAMTGPYSVSRNPLYLFSIIGAAGMGAQTGSIVVALICGAITWAVFSVVMRQEERLLLRIHGETYRHYLDTVPRLVPRSLWQEEKTLTMHPPKVLWAFIDALFFLLAVPIAEGCEYLRDAGLLPVLMRLY